MLPEGTTIVPFVPFTSKLAAVPAMTLQAPPVSAVPQPSVTVRVKVSAAMDARGGGGDGRLVLPVVVV